MCIIHDWLKQNAYYVDGGDVQQEHCGQARICLKCGLIKLIGHVSLPEEFMIYKQNIIEGRKWYKNPELVKKEGVNEN